MGFVGLHGHQWDSCFLTPTLWHAYFWVPGRPQPPCGSRSCLDRTGGRPSALESTAQPLNRMTAPTARAIWQCTNGCGHGIVPGDHVRKPRASGIRSVVPSCRPRSHGVAKRGKGTVGPSMPVALCAITPFHSQGRTPRHLLIVTEPIPAFTVRLGAVWLCWCPMGPAPPIGWRSSALAWEFCAPPPTMVAA